MPGACLLLAIVLSACDSLPMLGGGAKTSFDGDSALAFAGAQFAFGPRVPGTPAHKQAGDWIVERMRERADTVITQEWTHVTKSGQQLPMRNILARFRPEATQRVLYVTHWDSRPTADSDRNLGARQRAVPGANDGASGVGLFVALASALRKTPPTVGVDLLFVDGEDWGPFENPVDDTTKNRDVLIGSRHFVQAMPDYKPIFGVVWDMIGDRHLQIYQEGHSLQRAPEVVSRVWGVARELGYEKYFLTQSIAPITDDHWPFLEKGLRVIDVIDIDYCSDGGSCPGDNTRNLHHTVQDTMDKISARSLQIVGDVALTLVTR